MAFLHGIWYKAEDPKENKPFWMIILGPFEVFTMPVGGGSIGIITEHHTLGYRNLAPLESRDFLKASRLLSEYMATLKQELAELKKEIPESPSPTTFPLGIIEFHFVESDTWYLKPTTGQVIQVVEEENHNTEVYIKVLNEEEPQCDKFVEMVTADNVVLGEFLCRNEEGSLVKVIGLPSDKSNRVLVKTYIAGNQRQVSLRLVDLFRPLEPTLSLLKELQEIDE